MEMELYKHGITQMVEELANVRTSSERTRVMQSGLGATTSQCFYNRDSLATATDYEDKQINQRYICARYPFVEEGEFIMSASRPLIITYASSGEEKNRGLLMEYTTVDVG
ncbi:unnamed protein product, partial [Strongylus vulgaris]